MASPAVTSPPHKPLDPKLKAQFTLRLSDKITKGGASRNGFTSVKLNHKPSQKGPKRTSTITTSRAGASLTLEDKDRTGRYTYNGQRALSKRSYVLVIDQDKQTCTLEPVSASYKFNLRSTPSESSEAKLAQQYPQISLRDSQGQDDDDLFGEDSDDGDNPYDYRNFMAPSRGRDGTTSASPPLTASAANTPEIPAVLKPKLSAPTKKAVASTALRETKTKAPKTVAPRKARSPPHPTIEDKPEPPRIHLDRRASTRPSDKEQAKREMSASSEPESPSSPDGFEIDYGDSHPEKIKPRGLGLLLEGHGSGPISLRSAANSASPNSRLHTPQNADNDGDIDFGDTNGGADEDEDEYEDDDEDANGEPDYDVEPMTLGSPAQEQAKPPDDEDDFADFEEAMMEGMASEESESEEE